MSFIQCAYVIQVVNPANFFNNVYVIYSFILIIMLNLRGILLQHARYYASSVHTIFA